MENRLPPEEEKYLLGLAKKCEKNGFLKTAARILKEAGSEQQANAIWEKLAKKAERLGLLSVAAEMYEEAGMVKKASKCWRSLGEQLEEKGFLILADAVYTEALKDGNHPPHKNLLKRKLEQELANGNYINAAEDYEKLGYFKKAQKFWEKARKQAEKQKNYNMLHYILYRGQGKFKEAQDNETARGHFEEKKGNYSRAARTFARLGQFEKARKCFFQQAKSLEKKKKYYEAGLMYKLAGQIDRAEKMGKKLRDT